VTPPYTRFRDSAVLIYINIRRRRGCSEWSWCDVQLLLLATVQWRSRSTTSTTRRLSVVISASSTFTLALWPATVALLTYSLRTESPVSVSVFGIRTFYSYTQFCTQEYKQQFQHPTTNTGHDVLTLECMLHDVVMSVVKLVIRQQKTRWRLSVMTMVSTSVCWSASS